MKTSSWLALAGACATCSRTCRPAGPARPGPASWRRRATARPGPATPGSDFEPAFNDTTKITNQLLVEAGADDTAAQDDIALAVSMTKTLALSVGFGVRYNSDPPPLSGTTDTLATVNLVDNIQ